jgi:hypothetical protein
MRIGVIERLHVLSGIPHSPQLVAAARLSNDTERSKIMTVNTVNGDDFRAAAKQTYALLKPAFAAEERKYYWRLGHSFDTVIDYFATVAPDTHEADTFAELANEKYKAGGGYWYDDFAWWAIASLKAARRGNLFPRNWTLFAKIPLDLWQEIDSNAPYGWAKADQAKFAAYEPLFDGGVWNAILMDATPSSDCC